MAIEPLLLFNALVPKDRGSRRAARDVAYGPEDRQLLDIYAPRRMEGRPAPVLVFVHGGGWRTGEKNGYGFAGRAFAARGLVAVVAGYRLVQHARFPGFVEDAAAAVRWTMAHIADFGGDPGRIAIAGHSAGAQIAALVALDRSRLGERHAALAGWAGLAGPYDFLPLDTPVTKSAFGDVAELEATQPVAFAGPHSPPALLLHGEADHVVRPRQSERMAARLEEHGVPARLVRYPGIGHVRIVTALSRWTRRAAPVLDDLAGFVHGLAPAKPPLAD